MQDAMRKVEYVGGAWRNDLRTTTREHKAPEFIYACQLRHGKKNRGASSISVEDTRDRFERWAFFKFNFVRLHETHVSGIGQNVNKCYLISNERFQSQYAKGAKHR